MAKYLFSPSFPAGILKNKLSAAVVAGASSAVRGVIGFQVSKWKNLDVFCAREAASRSLLAFERTAGVNKRSGAWAEKNISRCPTSRGV